MNIRNDIKHNKKNIAIMPDIVSAISNSILSVRRPWSLADKTFRMKSPNMLASVSGEFARSEATARQLTVRINR